MQSLLLTPTCKSQVSFHSTNLHLNSPTFCAHHLGKLFFQNPNTKLLI